MKYWIIAEVIKRVLRDTYRGHYVWEQFSYEIAEYFSAVDPRFDRQQFLKNCGLNA